MKFLSFIICVVLACSMAVSSFALELETVPAIPSSGETVEEEYPAEEVVEDPTPETEVEPTPEVEETTTETDLEVEETNPDLSPILEDEVLVGVSFLSVAPITSGDVSGLKSVLLEVIGDYDPIIVEYEYENTNGYTSYLRDFMPDYVWCASFVMLALFVYCIFRLGGALIG